MASVSNNSLFRLNTTYPVIGDWLMPRNDVRIHVSRFMDSDSLFIAVAIENKDGSINSDYAIEHRVRPIEGVIPNHIVQFTTNDMIARIHYMFTDIPLPMGYFSL